MARWTPLAGRASWASSRSRVARHRARSLLYETSVLYGFTLATSEQDGWLPLVTDRVKRGWPGPIRRGRLP
jgi:hypothetical protein